MKSTTIQRTITERRVCNWTDVRVLCISNNFYTRGTNEEYNALAQLVFDHSDDMSTEVLCQVAEDILEHSDPEEAVGLDLGAMMYLLDNEVCHHCFDVH